MIVKPALILFFILNLLNVPGQEGDTLLPRILSLTNDTEKVNRLYQRGFSLRHHDPQLAWQYAMACEKTALRTGSGKHLAKSYNLCGVLFYKKGDYSTALAYHQKALRIRTAAGDIPGMAISQTNLGNIYVDMKLFSLAETAYLKALEAHTRLNDPERAANCLINLGAMQQHLGQQEAAYEFYARALKIGEQLHDYDIRAMCLNNIAIVFFEKGDYQRSIAFNEDAIKIKNLMENHLELADSYLNLALNYLRLKSSAQAKHWIDTAYSITLHYDYYEARVDAFHAYALYYSEVRDFEKAYYWLHKHSAARDSLLKLQAGEEVVTFPAISSHENQPAENKTLHNAWLLPLLFACMLFIPFILFQYKR